MYYNSMSFWRPLIFSTGQALTTKIRIWQNVYFQEIFSVPGTTCVCSCEMTSSLAVYPVPLSHMLCWVPTLCRQNWETLTKMTMAPTMLVTSTLPPTKLVNWRRGWWNCIELTGLRELLQTVFITERFYHTCLMQKRLYYRLY